MLLEVDLDLGREPASDERCTDDLAELGLRQQQEVVGPAPEDRHRRDDPPLGREQERLAGLARTEGLDVVREHALEVRGSFRPCHTDEAARPPADTYCCSRHAD